MSRDDSADNGVYYFLGNITSHILHALPLYKQLGGTFVVLSEKAKQEVEKYNVPVIAIDDKPRKWKRFGWRVKPVYHYLEIDDSLKKTADFLNDNAKVVLFYELYDFAAPVRITKPKTIFLTHGNMLKDYMGANNRLKVLEQYDYMAALGPYLKDQFINKNGISPDKLVDIGIARTDEIVAGRGRVVVPESLAQLEDFDASKPVISYMPTFWGASSVYTTGLEIVRNMPADYNLLFRPHPQTPDKLLQQYFDIMRTKPNVHYVPEGKVPGLGLNETILASSAIIGDVSSVMLEAILVDKPLIFAYDDSEHKQPESDYTSIADIVNASEKVTPDNAADLPAILARSLKSGIDKDVWQAAKTRNFFHCDGTSVDAISEFVQSISN